MKNALGIIVSREYCERVKRKSFIISTILTPLLMLAMMLVPSLMAILQGPEEKKVAVIDETGIIAPMLQNMGGVTFTTTNKPLDDLKVDETYDAILTIGPNAIADQAEGINFYTRSASSLQTESFIVDQIENSVRNIRIKAQNIENLDEILRQIEPDVELATFRIDQGEDQSTSSLLSYMLGMFTMLILYMFILLYGNMVMTSIIEEKSNRVLELVVSSVKPAQLMAGKIIGVGLVALTQVLIWTVLVLACSAFVMPTMIGMASSADPSMAVALGQLADVGFMARLMLFMTVFLVGGYLFYASIFAAIGSAVDNIQDASQLQSVATVPIILAIVIAMTVINDPNSSFAVWTSIIPFTSPMVMMARMPFGIPVWQEIVSAVTLFLSFMLLVWVAAKIYRVGIFMYGKKPSLMELIRWARYK